VRLSALAPVCADDSRDGENYLRRPAIGVCSVCVVVCAVVDVLCIIIIVVVALCHQVVRLFECRGNSGSLERRSDREAYTYMLIQSRLGLAAIWGVLNRLPIPTQCVANYAREVAW
jgi:hypothetical protein